MASASSSPTCSLASPTFADGKATPRQSAIGLPSLPPPPHVTSPNRPQGLEAWKTAAYCRRVAGKFIARATGEPTAEITTELPEIVKKLQEAWDKVEDKYAVSGLALVGSIALWSTGGMISAIDRLPVVPGVLELVGIGYTGWFAYKNLIFKPDREALVAKVKSIYNEITGSSSGIIN